LAVAEKRETERKGRPKAAQFDSDGFFAALDAARQDRRATWKEVADESGVSASTLTRMAQGKRPDIDGLAALTAWAGLTADQFVRFKRTPKKDTDTMKKITTYLRSDPNLSREAAGALEELVKATYARLRARR